MDAAGIPVPAREIREFSPMNMKSEVRHSPSARCVGAAHGLCRFLDIFRLIFVSYADKSSIQGNV